MLTSQHFLYQSFYSDRASESEVDRTLSYFHNSGITVDPHTAVALNPLMVFPKKLVGRGGYVDGPPIAVMSTAHPAKFPDVVEKITGELTQPQELAALAGKPERCADLPNDLASVMDFVATASNQ